LPTTIAELRALQPFEFQNWVIRERFNGAVGPKGGDKGIDGYSFMLHEPIQVKQSDGVGRNIIDNFHAALRRSKKKRGYIVAFSFGKGAYEEVAALKKREGIEVVLLTIEDLLSRQMI
jgi:Restriction endonuclease